MEKNREHLALPFKKTLRIITTGGTYIGRPIFVNQYVAVFVDVQQQMITPEGLVIFSNHELGGKIKFSRDAIIGVTNLEEECIVDNEENDRELILKGYSNNNAKIKRNKFTLVEKIDKNIEEREVLKPFKK